MGQRIPQKPIKTKFTGVILPHLNELRLDGDLRRRLVQHLNRLLDDIQLGRGRTHHQHTFAVVEINLIRRKHIHARRDKELAHHFLAVLRQIRRSHTRQSTAAANPAAAATKPTSSATTKATAAATTSTGNVNPRNIENATTTAAANAAAATTKTTAATPTPAATDPALSTAARLDEVTQWEGANRVETFDERVRVNLENAGFELHAQIGRLLGKDDRVFLDGIANRLVRNPRDRLEHIPEPHITNCRSDPDDHAAHVHRIRLLRRNHLSRRRINQGRSPGNDHVRVDQEVDSLLVRITFTGDGPQIIEHVRQRQAIKLNLVQYDAMEFGLDRLSARPGIGQVRGGKWIRARE